MIFLNTAATLACMKPVLRLLKPSHSVNEIDRQEIHDVIDRATFPLFPLLHGHDKIS